LSKKSAVGIAVCTFELSASAPGEIQLTPAGLFKARDGRPNGLSGWFIDNDIAQRVITRAAANADKFVVDYEHQTLYTKDNGKPAPAGGWYTQLEWRDGQGLFATDVEWTAAAKQAIENKEYLYISPVIIYDKVTGEVLGILMAALTNYAAIDGMADLEQMAAAKFSIEQSNQEDDSMSEALLKLLCLKEGASEDDINKAVTALKTKLDAAEKSEETITTLKANVETLTAAAGKPDPAKFVPVEMMTDLKTQVAELSTRLNANEVGDLVDVALSDGKLLPAQEGWARKLGEKDAAELKAYLESAQPIAALKGSQTKGEGPNGEGGDGELSAEEIAVCKSTGIDPEEYKKTKVA